MVWLVGQDGDSDDSSRGRGSRGRGRGSGRSRAVGGSELQIPNGMGVGTMAWGDARRGFMSKYKPDDLEAAFGVLVEGGVAFFDTADVYGHRYLRQGESTEELLGEFEASLPGYPTMVGTK